MVTQATKFCTMAADIFSIIIELEENKTVGFSQTQQYTLLIFIFNLTCSIQLTIIRSSLQN